MSTLPDKDMFDPKDFLAKVGAGKQVLEFHKNQHVFKQGDVADTVFYIQKGKVKLTVLSEQGKEAVVAILEPGQFFGEGCMNGHARRIATTTAMEDFHERWRRLKPSTTSFTDAVSTQLRTSQRNNRVHFPCGADQMGVECLSERPSRSLTGEIPVQPFRLKRQMIAPQTAIRR
jgi:hypothetical protein